MCTCLWWVHHRWRRGQVCGYVRFAPQCVGACEDVFPEYRETNFGQPELAGDVKITGGSFK